MGDQPGFPREFAEVVGDIHLELSTIDQTDGEVTARLIDYVQELIRSTDNPDRMVRYLASGMMCLFMAGREHALRGYPAPLPRVDQVGDGWVPNTVNDLFEGGVDEHSRPDDRGGRPADNGVTLGAGNECESRTAHQ